MQCAFLNPHRRRRQTEKTTEWEGTWKCIFCHLFLFFFFFFSASDGCCLFLANKQPHYFWFSPSHISLAKSRESLWKECCCSCYSSSYTCLIKSVFKYGNRKKIILESSSGNPFALFSSQKNLASHRALIVGGGISDIRGQEGGTKKSSYYATPQNALK